MRLESFFELWLIPQKSVLNVTNRLHFKFLVFINLLYFNFSEEYMQFLKEPSIILLDCHEGFGKLIFSNSACSSSQTYLKLSQTSKMQLFAKIGALDRAFCLTSLTVFVKGFILDQTARYASIALTLAPEENCPLTLTLTQTKFGCLHLIRFKKS